NRQSSQNQISGLRRVVVIDSKKVSNTTRGASKVVAPGAAGGVGNSTSSISPSANLLRSLNLPTTRASSILPIVDWQVAHQLVSSTAGDPLKAVSSGGEVRNGLNQTQCSSVAPQVRVIASAQQPQSTPAGGAARNDVNQGALLNQQWPMLQFSPAVESRRFICFVCGVVVADPVSAVADQATMQANFAKMNRLQLAQLQVASAMGGKGVAVVCKTHSLHEWLQRLQQVGREQPQEVVKQQFLQQLQHLQQASRELPQLDAAKLQQPTTSRKRSHEDESVEEQSAVKQGGDGGQESVRVQDEAIGLKDEEIIDVKKVKMVEE
ncbi:hypothetical protein PENTCL1PPCAC_19886, partial [Pristionchus entomophagus]